MKEYLDSHGTPLPAEFRPLNPWAYFGYTLLFSIPVVGFVFLLIFSLGGARNINLRNYARSYFCMLALICVILAIWLVILFTAGGAAAIGEYLSMMM